MPAHGDEWLAADGANSANSANGANDSNRVDRGDAVYLRENRRVVLRCCGDGVGYDGVIVCTAG